MKNTAVILTKDTLGSMAAKTAHGLLRFSDKYQIIGVLDEVQAGTTTKTCLHGCIPDLPVFGDIESICHLDAIPDYAIIGAAFAGGKLPDSWRPLLREVISHGISIISGLHQFLSDDEELYQLAIASGAELIDIRQPKPFNELRFWSGEILNLKLPRIGVLGIDCDTGKRTTARIITDTLRENKVKAEMIYTGQTGFLQGHKYGFILDATPNDFVSGELERSILECAAKENPEIIIIEGQSSLRNPSGPCGAELILSGGCQHVILQHTPFRKDFDGFEGRAPLPTIQSEVKLIEAYGATVIGIAINGEGMTIHAIASIKNSLAKYFNIPIFDPIHSGVEALLPIIKKNVLKVKP